MREFPYKTLFAKAYLVLLEEYRNAPEEERQRLRDPLLAMGKAFLLTSYLPINFLREM